MKRNCLLLLKLMRIWACFSWGVLGVEMRNFPVMPSWKMSAKLLSVHKISRLARRVTAVIRALMRIWAVFFQVDLRGPLMIEGFLT